MDALFIDDLQLYWAGIFHLRKKTEPSLTTSGRHHFDGLSIFHPNTALHHCRWDHFNCYPGYRRNAKLILVNLDAKPVSSDNHAEMSRLFSELNLDPRVLDGILDMGYREMTPIQEQAIPLILEGNDLIGAAQTGTGKTAAFLIPLIDRLARLPKRETRALILTPTRELALQIDEQMSGLAYHVGLSSTCIIGGMSFGHQEHSIRRKAELLIATPGRMIDHLRFDHVDFSTIEYLVLDEADRMLDMGFLPDVTKIIDGLPKQRQTLLFSATIDDKVKRLANQFMKNPQQIQIGRLIPVEAIQQRFFVRHGITGS